MIGAVRAFVAATFRQMVSDPTALFFTIVLPVGIIVIVGSTFGGVTTIDVALVGPPSDTVTALREGLEGRDGVSVVVTEDEEQVRRDLRRFDLRIAVLVPADVDDDLAAGRAVDLTYLVNEADPDQFASLGIVAGVLDEVAAPSGAAAALAEAGADPAAAAAATAETAAGLPATATPREIVGRAAFTSASPFSLTAAQNLVLFTFITSLTSATLLVRARRDGIVLRALASPAGAPAIVVGITAAWLLLALLQSLLIVVIGAVGFGVEWGDPLGVAATIVVFALCGAGAGLLAGAVFGNEERLGAAAAPLGIVLGALGGCMVPAEFFPDGFRTVSRFVPHSWALEAWQTLIFDGGGPADIVRPLGVLAVFAAGFLATGTILLRRSLTRA